MIRITKRRNQLKQTGAILMLPTLLVWISTVARAEQQPRLVIYGIEGDTGTLAFSPDGSRLAMGRGNVVWVCDTLTGQEQLLLRGDGLVSGVAFRPDGKILASCYLHGRVKLWQVESGQELSNFLGPLYVSPPTRLQSGWQGAGRRIGDRAALHTLVISHPR